MRGTTRCCPSLLPALGAVPFSPFCADASRMLHAAQRTVAAAEAQAKRNAQLKVQLRRGPVRGWRGSASAKSRGAVLGPSAARRTSRTQPRRRTGSKAGGRSYGDPPRNASMRSLYAARASCSPSLSGADPPHAHRIARSFEDTSAACFMLLPSVCGRVRLAEKVQRRAAERGAMRRLSLIGPSCPSHANGRTRSPGPPCRTA